MDHEEIAAYNKRVKELTLQALEVPHGELARQNAIMLLQVEQQSNAINVYEKLLREILQAINEGFQGSSKASPIIKKLVAAVVELEASVEKARQAGFEAEAYKASERGRAGGMATAKNYQEGKNFLKKKWLEGAYKTKSACALNEHQNAGLSYSTAEKTLRNLPNPASTE